MESLISQTQLFFQDETARPLGRLTLAGTIKKVGGGAKNADDMARQMRVLGRYAIVLVVAGEGQYRDALGTKIEVRAGDVILIFPELAHSYGPGAGQRWDEIYLCFDGPVFELWRRERLLNPAHPIHQVEDIRSCFLALQKLVQSPRPLTVPEHLNQINDFLAILGNLVSLQEAPRSEEKPWLQRAKAVLEANLGSPASVEAAAQAAGLSYDHFRKAFARETGISPVRYRDLKRIEAAKVLLQRVDMTHSVVARSLGFRDEAHFSNRFKQLVGVVPREFRRGGNTS